MNTPNVVSNFSANSPSWGRIERGTLIMNPQMANMSIEDILADADLAFQPKLVATWIDNPWGDRIQSGAYSVVREDTWQELGKGFSDGYTPVSYLDALSGLFGDVKKLGGIPTRAINFGDGKRTALQFILGDSWFIKDREHKLFFNTYAGHDGTTGILFNSSDVCIVCGNTYALAKADKTLRFSARHTSNVTARLAEIRQAVFAIEENAKPYYSLLENASRVKANDGLIAEFANFIFPDQEKKEDAKRDNRARENQRAELIQSVMVTAAETDGNPTIYDLMGGYTRFVSYKTQRRTAEEQFQYAMTQTANNGPKVLAWAQEKING